MSFYVFLSEQTEKQPIQTNLSDTIQASQVVKQRELSNLSSLEYPNQLDLDYTVKVKCHKLISLTSHNQLIDQCFQVNSRLHSSKAVLLILDQTTVRCRLYEQHISQLTVNTTKKQYRQNMSMIFQSIQQQQVKSSDVLSLTQLASQFSCLTSQKQCRLKLANSIICLR